MKNIICLLLCLIISIQTVYAVNASAAAEAKKSLTASADMLRSACQNVRKGLRYEYSFINFFNYECSNYYAKRLRTRDAIFPIVNNITKGYNEEYPKISTEFVLALDKKQLEYYKLLVENYCKYNAYKMNEQSGCSAQKIKSYFDVNLSK